MKVYKKLSVRVIGFAEEVFLKISDEADINNDEHWTDNY